MRASDRARRVRRRMTTSAAGVGWWAAGQLPPWSGRGQGCSSYCNGRGRYGPTEKSPGGTDMSTAQRAAVVLLSGGLDSATALAVARRDDFRCHALTVAYGQRHTAELAAARRV